MSNYRYTLLEKHVKDRKAFGYTVKDLATGRNIYMPLPVAVDNALENLISNATTLDLHTLKGRGCDLRRLPMANSKLTQPSSTPSQAKPSVELAELGITLYIPKVRKCSLCVSVFTKARSPLKTSAVETYVKKLPQLELTYISSEVGSLCIEMELEQLSKQSLGSISQLLSYLSKTYKSTAATHINLSYTNNNTNEDNMVSYHIGSQAFTSKSLSYPNTCNLLANLLQLKQKR